jgi:NAD-dependent deacetylase
VENKNIVILTGAGISQESGIPTFRTGDDPVWGSSFIKYFTINALRTNRVETINVYNERKKKFVINNYQPNAAHYAIAKLQAEYKNGHVSLITQNIDDLHQKAGSYALTQMHGSLFEKKRIDTNAVSYWGDEELNPDLERPNIVLFGESVFGENDIKAAMRKCGLFVAIGTSLMVSPASEIVEMAKKVGARTVFINKETALGDERFDERIYGNATEVVPKFVDGLLK